jgi:hypothetical protein
LLGVNGVDGIDGYGAGRWPWQGCTGCSTGAAGLLPAWRRVRTFMELIDG